MKSLKFHGLILKMQSSLTNQKLNLKLSNNSMLPNRWITLNYAYKVEVQWKLKKVNIGVKTEEKWKRQEEKEERISLPPPQLDSFYKTSV